jgi:serine phosphatase RsbU (regulator of sigma subunit)
VAGILPAAEFSERVVPLSAGDAVVLYTDGVSEARSDGEQFGDRQFVEVLTALSDASAQAIADGLTSASHAFGRDALEDDAAVFVLRILPPG